MNNYQLGRTSLERLSTCHEDLQKIILTAIALSPIDFGVAEGHRSVERQKLLFDEGKSKIDGINKKGKHNYNPSLAVDIYAYVNGKAMWEERHLCTIAGIIIATANMMHMQGEIESTLRWGGNWDGDGEIISDQTFMDLPHFELKFN